MNKFSMGKDGGLTLNGIPLSVYGVMYEENVEGHAYITLVLGEDDAGGNKTSSKTGAYVKDEHTIEIAGTEIEILGYKYDKTNDGFNAIIVTVEIEPVFMIPCSEMIDNVNS